ncbi:MAG: hypothetical protein SVX43_22175 [Cyanobacteriota bacterium]|nr:hypothetical protein [Cyanobacteriota bacterium]
MEFIKQLTEFLVRAIVTICTVALLFIFLATLIALLGIEVELPDFLSFLSGIYDFFAAQMDSIGDAGEFLLRIGHRLLVAAIIGAMIYFVLSLFTDW